MDRPSEESRRLILVTGASGLIGSELCGQLVERGHAVIALMHNRRHVVRNDGRRMDPLPYTGTLPERGTLSCVAGDIRKLNLDLEKKIATALASTVELIVHCAAETKFMSTSRLHRSINVEGTSNIIRFAKSSSSEPTPGLIHLSTAYVSGERSGPVAEEDLDCGQSFANDYEASKAEAEKLVSASGLCAVIARPSIVVGRSDTGAIGRFENFYAFLKLIASGRIGVLPVSHNASVDLVPIDHVIGGLIDIIEQHETAAGKIFHLVSGNPTPISALTALEYPGFYVPKLVLPDELDLSLLRPSEHELHDRVTSAYAAYLRRNPRFATRNLLSLSGRMCSVTGLALLRRVINFAAAAGYLVPKNSTSAKFPLTI